MSEHVTNTSLDVFSGAGGRGGDRTHVSEGRMVNCWLNIYTTYMTQYEYTHKTHARAHTHTHVHTTQTHTFNPNIHINHNTSNWWRIDYSFGFLIERFWVLIHLMPFRTLALSFIPYCSSSLSFINTNLGVDSDGYLYQIFIHG